MNRFGISTAQLLRRRSPTQRPPAVDTYRDRPGHLADAGGAYLVLPYGLLHTLNGDQQQHLVEILTALAAIDRRWVATTTYQVLPWARIRPGDLTDEELAWHGITSDIDPASGAVAYSRGGNPCTPTPSSGTAPLKTRFSHPPGRTQAPGRHSCPSALERTPPVRRQQPRGVCAPNGHSG